MTTQKAIDVLQNSIVRFGRNCGKTVYEEALNMAVEALKETDMGLNNGDHLHPFGEPFGWTEEEIQKHGLRELLKEVDNENDELSCSEKPNNSDLISRTDAIDEIRMLMEQSEDDEHDRIWNMALVGAMNAVRHHTPSAEPKTANSGSLEKEMPEIKADRTTGGIIYRQDAIDALARAAREKFNLSDEYNQYLAGLMDAQVEIKYLPSAQPEIIRCKECEHWDTSWQNDYAPNYLIALW